MLFCFQLVLCFLCSVVDSVGGGTLLRSHVGVNGMMDVEEEFGLLVVASDLSISIINMVLVVEVE